MNKIIFTLLWLGLSQVFVFADTAEESGVFEKNGVSFTNASFYPSGHIKDGLLSKASVIDGLEFMSATGAIPDRAGGVVRFYESGAVEEGPLAKDTTINGLVFKSGVFAWGGIAYNLGYVQAFVAPLSSTQFYEDGKVAVGALAYPQDIKGLKFVDVVEFGKDGSVTGTLAEDFTPAGLLKAGEFIEIYPGGKLKTLYAPAEIDGIKFSGSYSSGKNGSDWGIGGIEFYESGKIKRGQLSVASTISGTQFDIYDVVEFDEEGNPVHVQVLPYYFSLRLKETH